jgi:hypothetical protein
MRKLFTILAVLGLAVGMSARNARADGVVDYTVKGTYATGTGFSSTALSNPGDSFTFSFSIDSALLGPISSGSIMDIPVTFNYTDFVGMTTNHSLTGQAGSVNLNDESTNPPGLIDLAFTFGGDLFFLQLSGLDPGFIITKGTPALNTGTFMITPGGTGADAGLGSLFGDGITGNFAAIAAGGTVAAIPATAVPEPSSLLLLGSGFLALGGFARKRLVARVN